MPEEVAEMSDKSLSSTRETPLRQPIERAWGSSPAKLQGLKANEMKLLRSWLVYDSDLQDSALQPGPASGRVNWNVLLGLAVATAVSAGIWAVIGWIVASRWK
jgi:hypothetical protein